MAQRSTVRINRAPVLTLWATVVAERLGFDHDEALTLGRAVARLNAYSKGVSLRLFEPSKKTVEDHREKMKHGARLTVALLHRAVPVVHTKDGLRALSKDRPIAPASVERYLASKFGDNLGRVTTAMKNLAASLPPKQIAAHAYSLCEKFRPKIPSGVRGWGAQGELDLGLMGKMAKQASLGHA